MVGVSCTFSIDRKGHYSSLEINEEIEMDLIDKGEKCNLP